MSIRRNQVIIAALVVMIAVAGYLNYIDTTQRPNGGAITYSDDLGRASSRVLDEVTGQEVMIVNANQANETSGTVITPMDGDIGIALTMDEIDSIPSSSLALSDVINTPQAADDATADKGMDEAGNAVFANYTNDSSFFVQAKLDREQSRAKQKETLTELINNQNVAKEQKADCANSMLEIQHRIEKETAAEALIEAKGFTEAYVRIVDDSVDVVVSKSVLSDAEIAQIEDIVKRKTGIDTENIRVAPLKAN